LLCIADLRGEKMSGVDVLGEGGFVGGWSWFYFDITQ